MVILGILGQGVGGVLRSGDWLCANEEASEAEEGTGSSFLWGSRSNREFFPTMSFFNFSNPNIHH